jgi:outer membrane protein OmpA-like peptidoglycan-associated protein
MHWKGFAVLILLFNTGSNSLAQSALSMPGVRYLDGFAPAEQTVFFSDFTVDTTGACLKNKWQNSDSDLVISQFGLSYGKQANLSGKLLRPIKPGSIGNVGYVTFECDFRLVDSETSTLKIGFVDASGRVHLYSIDQNWFTQHDVSNPGKAAFTVPIRNKVPGSLFDPGGWHCAAFSFSEKSMHFYIDAYQVWGIGNDATDMTGEYHNTYYELRPSMFELSGKSAVLVKSVRFAVQDMVPVAGKIQIAQFDKILSGATFVTSNVLFDANSAKISASSMPFIAAMARWLDENVTVNMEIAGHTDGDGSDEANLVLSLARARAIADKLVLYGVSENRLKVVGHGETKPVDSNDTEKGKAANRRVEFRKI